MCSDFETEHKLQPNHFQKRQNRNVPISDVYCISKEIKNIESDQIW